VSAPAAAAASAPHTSVLEAVLERITYANEETGYTIARVATERTGSDLLTVVGPLLGAQVGESLRLTGRWGSHPKYGRQFQVHSYTTVLPATIQGIRRYLGSGLIKGIGPTMAERMVTHFGTDILTIIDEQPGRLTEVHGLGPKRTQRIADAWEEQKAIKEVMVFLSGIGVSTSLAVRIYKAYRDDSITIVRSEPYRLASEVWGIGFKTADTIAQAVGIPHDSSERIKAGLQYTLSEATDNGHCYLPEPDLIRDATTILQVDQALISPCLDALVAEEGVIRESLPADDNGDATVAAVYLVPFHRAERSLAGGLLTLLNASDERLPAFAEVDWQTALGWLRTRTGQDLAPAQEEAVKLALTSKVAVLTGGPGCGKSFTIRSVVTLAAAKHATVILVAPTGRAAKRLAELTGHESSTVHRLLELQPGGEPRYDRENPLDADLLVVDECSMMDAILANKLTKAIPEGAHVLLVGDVDQLPSVGAGEVLRDLLAATTIPGSVSPRSSAKPNSPGSSSTPTASTAAARPSSPAFPTSTGSPATPPPTATCTPPRRPPSSSSTSSPAASPPNSGSTRSATSRCSPRRTVGPPARATSTPSSRRSSPRRATAPWRSATATGSSGSVTRSPSCATTTPKATPGSSTAPSAPSPDSHSRSRP
jgi:exodeoxyribonuclease V alpha subunit